MMWLVSPDRGGDFVTNATETTIRKWMCRYVRDQKAEGRQLVNITFTYRPIKFAPAQVKKL
jgi:hypothetical protein